jgi:succinate dehydrogenase / fumarate reductase flavoprotein subunit
LPKDSADLSLSRLDHFRNASGGSPTAQMRLRMQKVMQNNCAVFRTGETLDEGHKLIPRPSMTACRTSMSPTVR